MKTPKYHTDREKTGSCTWMFTKWSSAMFDFLFWLEIQDTWPRFYLYHDLPIDLPFSNISVRMLPYSRRQFRKCTQNICLYFIYINNNKNYYITWAHNFVCIFFNYFLWIAFFHVAYQSTLYGSYQLSVTAMTWLTIMEYMSQMTMDTSHLFMTHQRVCN